jgi:hypothetical protein
MGGKSVSDFVVRTKFPCGVMECGTSKVEVMVLGEGEWRGRAHAEAADVRGQPAPSRSRGVDISHPLRQIA